MWSFIKDASNSEESDAGCLDKVDFISAPANDCKGCFDGDVDVDGEELSDFAYEFRHTDCSICP